MEWEKRRQGISGLLPLQQAPVSVLFVSWCVSRAAVTTYPTRLQSLLHAFFPVVEGAIGRQSVAAWDLGLGMRWGASTMGSLPRDLAPAGRLKHLSRLRTRHRHAVSLRYHTDPYKMYRYQHDSREKKKKQKKMAAIDPS